MNVGTASSEHDLTGDAITMQRTSSGAHARRRLIGGRRWRHAGSRSTNVVDLPCKEWRKKCSYTGFDQAKSTVTARIAMTSDGCSSDALVI